MTERKVVWHVILSPSEHINGLSAPYENSQWEQLLPGNLVIVTVTLDKIYSLCNIPKGRNTNKGQLGSSIDKKY